MAFPWRTILRYLGLAEQVAAPVIPPQYRPIATVAGEIALEIGSEAAPAPAAPVVLPPDAAVPSITRPSLGAPLTDGAKVQAAMTAPAPGATP